MSLSPTALQPVQVNGKRWTRVCLQAPWLPRHSFAILSVGKYMYLLGGKHERATGLGAPGVALPGLGNSSNSGHSNSTSGNNSSSSSNGTQVMNDVWRSVDGSLWELLAVESPWSARYGHAAAMVPTESELESSKPLLPRIVLAGGNGDQNTTSSGDGGTLDDTAATATASDVWCIQFREASAFAGVGSAQGAAGGGGWDGGGGGELANSGVPLSGVPLSMQAVVSSVVDL